MTHETLSIWFTSTQKKSVVQGGGVAKEQRQFSVKMEKILLNDMLINLLKKTIKTENPAGEHL